jgi:hypothetical protein
MISFLSGAITLGFFLAGAFFIRFWRKTGDRLFIHFAVAFWLFALNQGLAWALGDSDERTGYTYILRIAGYIIILFAIVDKNTTRSDKSR